VKRLKEYHAQTTPIVNHYSPAGIVNMVPPACCAHHTKGTLADSLSLNALQIDGDCGKKEVWAQIEKACPPSRV